MNWFAVRGVDARGIARRAIIFASVASRFRSSFENGLLAFVNALEMDGLRRVFLVVHDLFSFRLDQLRKYVPVMSTTGQL
jgi:hypothetical protein